MLQRPLRVGYLGPEGTFTHEAALKLFGASSEYVPCATIEDVFLETEKGNVDHGVVGIENSTAGAVTPTLDLLVDATVQVCAELELPISHYLLGRGDLSEVRRVCSHPQALAQCRRWLGQNLPNAERVEVASTVLAARQAESSDTAAIAPAAAAKLYGLRVLAPRIEDSSANVTRFFVLGRSRSPRTGQDKSAIVFAVKNRPGALRDALEVFARRAIDLTRIESRPSRRRLWEYVFFADFRGHPDDEAVAAALAELEAGALFVKVLGAWPVDSGEGSRSTVAEAGPPS
jgi:chorismate mutase/prephenate dehydratase